MHYVVSYKFNLHDENNHSEQFNTAARRAGHRFSVESDLNDGDFLEKVAKFKDKQLALFHQEYEEFQSRYQQVDFILSISINSQDYHFRDLETLGRYFVAGRAMPLRDEPPSYERLPLGEQDLPGRQTSQNTFLEVYPCVSEQDAIRKLNTLIREMAKAGKAPRSSHTLYWEGDLSELGLDASEDDAELSEDSKEAEDRGAPILLYQSLKETDTGQAFTRRDSGEEEPKTSLTQGCTLL